MFSFDASEPVVWFMAWQLTSIKYAVIFCFYYNQYFILLNIITFIINITSCINNIY